MTDAAHLWGYDLNVGPTGDLALVSNDTETQQRIVRRLLTAAGDYIQQLGYGAGLGQFVGQPTNIPNMIGIIKNQMKSEATVAQNPSPSVSIIAPAGTNVVTCTINYTDAVTGSPSVLTFPVQ